jgi:hypothetical protein
MRVWKNWISLVVSALFTVAGALIFVTGNEPRFAIGVIAFSGGCLIFSVVDLLSRLRARTDRSAENVEIVGGVPLRVSRSRWILGSGLGFVIGTVAVWGISPHMPLLLTWGGAFCVCVAGLFFVGTVSGQLLNQQITFRPEGLEVQFPRLWFTIPWDQITEVAEREYAGQLVVTLGIANPSSVRCESAAKFQKMLTTNQNWAGCDVLIFCSQFGVSSALLARAVQTYCKNPEKRASLVPVLPSPR